MKLLLSDPPCANNIKPATRTDTVECEKEAKP